MSLLSFFPSFTFLFNFVFQVYVKELFYWIFRTLKWIQSAHYFQRERERERVVAVQSWEVWSGGAMVLGKLSVPGRPTNFNNSRARAYCACSRFGTFSLSSIFSLFFLPLWKTVRYILKYCLKGPFHPKQLTNQIHSWVVWEHQSITATMFTLKFRTKCVSKYIWLLIPRYWI